MTLEELNTLLLSTGLPVAYQAFPSDDVPTMPFIVYQETGSDNFGADNVVWASAMIVQIDLLCHKKNRDTEELLENTLTSNGIYWERESYHESDDDFYRSTYSIELLGG